MSTQETETMKTMKLFHWRYMIGLACTAAFLTSGCTHNYKQPIHEINFAPATEQLDLLVALEVTDSFRNAKWEKHSMGDTFIMPMGDNLVHQTNRLMRSVFRNPIIPDEATPAEKVDADFVLRPKLAFVEQSFGVTAFSQASTSIGIEWNLMRKSGESVWIESIKGVGIGQAGNIFTGSHHQEKRFQAALQDLFEKSQEAMLSSQLLRRLP
jgi:hypothetical protein